VLLIYYLNGFLTLSFVSNKSLIIFVSFYFSYSSSSSVDSEDNATPDNFMIEIYLNKPIQIGCFQVKLRFNRDLTTPYELRLFKQKKHFDTNGFGAGIQPTNVDNKIDFFK
jgi:hypothetical protein